VAAVVTKFPYNNSDIDSKALEKSRALMFITLSNY